jgi:hypothetical protein
MRAKRPGTEGFMCPGFAHAKRSTDYDRPPTNDDRTANSTTSNDHDIIGTGDAWRIVNTTHACGGIAP